MSYDPEPSESPEPILPVVPRPDEIRRQIGLNRVSKNYPKLVEYTTNEIKKQVGIRHVMTIKPPPHDEYTYNDYQALEKMMREQGWNFQWDNHTTPSTWVISERNGK